jgi:hypothetical protein
MTGSWILLTLGLAVVVTRAPLIFRPSGALAVYGRLVATSGRARALGALYSVLGLGSVHAAWQAGGVATQLLFALGIVLLGMAAWLLAAPDHFRGVADGVLRFARESVDTALVRLLGVLGVGVGTLLIWLGAGALLDVAETAKHLELFR